MRAGEPNICPSMVSAGLGAGLAAGRAPASPNICDRPVGSGTALRCSPSAKAGIRAGDVITGFEGKRIRTPDQLIVSIRARAVGDTVTITVQRDGKPVDLRMTLEADPEN